MSPRNRFNDGTDAAFDIGVDELRRGLLRQHGCVLWLTGLPGAGKSTIAFACEEALLARGHATFVLDGDRLRKGLNSDLGFSEAARAENVRRTAEVAALFADAGLIVCVALISPLREHRALARAVVGEERFVEVFVDAPLDECERRDPKGLYRRARQGEIADFTGVSAPYEPPLAADVHLATLGGRVEDAVAQLLELLTRRGAIFEGSALRADASRPARG